MDMYEYEYVGSLDRTAFRRTYDHQEIVVEVLRNVTFELGRVRYPERERTRGIRS